MLVWLSFADPHRPQGQTFVGVVVVQLPDYYQQRPQEAVEFAMSKAGGLGILHDMHGCMSLEGAGLQDAAIPEEFWNKMLSAEEIALAEIGFKHTTKH